MSERLLRIDHEKCTGCRLCELVCAVRHHQVSNPTKSRIRVIKWEAEGVYVPMACQQCEDAPCQKACPAKAIAREHVLPGGPPGRTSVGDSAASSARPPRPLGPPLSASGTALRGQPLVVANGPAAAAEPALANGPALDRVTVDYDKCIGCRTCVAVCPFGAMHFVPSERKVIKCDLCDGEPQCVRFCDVHAVEFVAPGDVGLQKGRGAARRLVEAERKGAELLTGER